MSNPDTDKKFAGSIPRLYDEHLVPLIFAPYAEDLAHRVALHQPARVLEMAAGTGVVTRRMTSVLPPGTTIIATDLNQAMLDIAAEVGTSRPVTWRQADAMQLPFEDNAFDAVVCQFGMMFMPEKSRAFAEARRVLQPGGTFFFNVWDRIEENEFARIVTASLEPLFPDDPPRFLARTPHGYHDRATIERDLQAGGFVSPPRVETLAARSKAASPRIPAHAYCHGTPLRNEIEARDPSKLAAATQLAEDAITQAFGSGPVDGKIQAHIVVVGR